MATGGETSAHERRTEGLLRALTRAREDGDGDRERGLMAELLSIFNAWLRPQAEARFYSADPSGEAAADVVNRTLKRIADMLARKLSFNKALWQVALDNFEWEVTDYWRRQARMQERPEDPAGLDPVDPDLRPGEQDRPSLVEEAMALRRQLEGSSDADIRLLGLRFLHGLGPQQIADQLGMTRAAVDTALSRAVQRVRERRSAAGADRDVRDSNDQTEG